MPNLLALPARMILRHLLCQNLSIWVMHILLPKTYETFYIIVTIIILRRIMMETYSSKTRRIMEVEVEVKLFEQSVKFVEELIILLTNASNCVTFFKEKLIILILDHRHTQLMDLTSLLLKLIQLMYLGCYTIQSFTISPMMLKILLI